MSDFHIVLIFSNIQFTNWRHECVDFHIVGIFNDYYAQIVAVIAIADAEQKQIQTSCNSTAPITYISIKGSESVF